MMGRTSTGGCLDVGLGELFNLIGRGDVVGGCSQFSCSSTGRDECKIRGVVCVVESVFLGGVFCCCCVADIAFSKTSANSLANIGAIFIIEVFIASFNAPCHEVDGCCEFVVCCCWIFSNANLTISDVIIGRVRIAFCGGGACRKDFEVHGNSSLARISTFAGTTSTAGISTFAGISSLAESLKMKKKGENFQKLQNKK
jgi:hypothetical protein